jgi:hypothetical protein
MNSYKIFSLALSIVFAVVGFIFLLIPDGVLVFFNTISSSIGFPTSPVAGVNFYLILALGYMYVVTLLAFFMYRHPENRALPLLLANAKIASSILSFCLAVFYVPYLIYIVNGIVDGLIGITVLAIYFQMGVVEKA